VPGLILATVTPDNTPGGAVLTFAFPLGLFVIIVVVLYLWLGRPHRRVPADLTPVGSSATVDAPHPGVARGASVAAGLPTAVGGGGAESAVEPAGGVRKAEDNGTSAPAAGTEGPAAGTSETAAGTTEPSAGTTEPSAGTPEDAAGTTSSPGEVTESAADSGTGTSAAESGTGNVAGQDTAPEASDPERGTADGTEASE
jgi:hypothetical protein